MNIDTEGLTLEQRFDLVLSNKAIERELDLLAFPRIQADFLDTTTLKEKMEQLEENYPKRKQAGHQDEFSEENETGQEFEMLLENHKSMQDAFQCMICYCPPIWAKECKRCSQLLCFNCQQQLQRSVREEDDQEDEDDEEQQKVYKCPSCRHQNADFGEVFQDIKNIITKNVILSLKVNHRCNKSKPLKYHTIHNLQNHLQECKGLLVSCPCKDSNCSNLSITDMRRHLKEHCKQVKISCSECYDPSLKSKGGTYTRAKFMEHTCRKQLQSTIDKFGKDREFIIRQSQEYFERKKSIMKTPNYQHLVSIKCPQCKSMENLQGYKAAQTGSTYECSFCQMELEERYMKCNACQKRLCNGCVYSQFEAHDVK